MTSSTGSCTTSRAVDKGQDGVRRLFDALDEIRVERKCLAVQPRELDHVTSFEATDVLSFALKVSAPSNRS